MVNIPDKSDGEILYADDTYKFAGSGGTFTSSGSTSETEIGEHIVPENTVHKGILIIAQVKYTLDNNGGSAAAQNNIVVRLRVGESDTATSNTLVGSGNGHSQQSDDSGQNACSYVKQRISSNIITFYSGADWTNSNYIHVTAQVTATNGSGCSAECEEIQVLGF